MIDHPGLAEAKPVKIKTANWWVCSNWLLCTADSTSLQKVPRQKVYTVPRGGTMQFEQENRLQMLSVQIYGLQDWTVCPEFVYTP